MLVVCAKILLCSFWTGRGLISQRMLVVYHRSGQRSRHWEQNMLVRVWFSFFLGTKYYYGNNYHSDNSNYPNNNTSDSPSRWTIYAFFPLYFQIQSCLVIPEFWKVLAVHLFGPIKIMLMHERGTVFPYFFT